MRIWVGLLLVLLLPGLSLAKKPAQSQLDNQLKKAQKAINKENDIAYDIFLRYPDSARKIAEHTLLQAEKIKYSYGIAQSYYHIGSLYWSQSYFPIALFYHNNALNNAPNNDPLLLSDIYSGIGRDYADLGDYAKAMLNLDKCEHYAGDDKLRLGEAYSEKSYLYMKLHKYDKAILAAKISLELNRDVGELKGAAIIYSRLGDLYYAKHDYKRALAYDDTAFTNSKILHIRRLQAAMYNEYARINNDLHKYDNAIEYAKKGIALFDSIGVMNGLSEGYKALITSFEGKADLKQALYYERQYNRVQDNLNTVDKNKSTQLIRNYFELSSRLNNLANFEKKNEDSKSKIEFQHIIINILVIAVVFLLAVLSITYYFYNQKMLLSKKLQEKHEELSDQKKLIETQAANLTDVNNLKNKMLAVVGHDLRTPIANLHNILELFEDDYLTPEEVHNLMRDVSPVVKGTELTLSNLLDWAGSQIKGRSIEKSNIDVHLLGAEMEQTFKHSLKQKRLNFNNKAKKGQFIIADENHVKVVLRNLVSNAIKFTGDNGNITLSTEIDGDKLITAVEDTGTGMSAEKIKELFSDGINLSLSGTLGEVGTGLGLLLCTELLVLNNSKLNVKSVPGYGTKFYFSLPLVK